ncbi:MAG TPA: hypothetical protein VEI06_02430 [Gemmatimonadaceae bacterium]|nr:hypothetical protein [Gemmatimonadaceae bacterium]
MTEIFDTSSLGDTPAQWDALAARIVRTAGERDTALGWIGHGRAAWAVSGLTAAALVFALLARSASPRIVARDVWLSTLAPREVVALGLADPSGPPRLESVLMPPRVGARSP